MPLYVFHEEKMGMPLHLGGTADQVHPSNHHNHNHNHHHHNTHTSVASSSSSSSHANHATSSATSEVYLCQCNEETLTRGSKQDHYFTLPSRRKDDDDADDDSKSTLMMRTTERHLGNKEISDEEEDANEEENEEDEHEHDEEDEAVDTQEEEKEEETMMKMKQKQKKKRTTTISNSKKMIPICDLLLIQPDHSYIGALDHERSILDLLIDSIPMHYRDCGGDLIDKTLLGGRYTTQKYLDMEWQAFYDEQNDPSHSSYSSSSFSSSVVGTEKQDAAAIVLKGPLKIESSSVSGFSFFQRLLRDDECYSVLRTFLVKESHVGKDILEFWYVRES